MLMLGNDLVYDVIFHFFQDGGIFYFKVFVDVLFSIMYRCTGHTPPASVIRSNKV